MAAQRRPEWPTYLLVSMCTIAVTAGGIDITVRAGLEFEPGLCLRGGSGRLTSADFEQLEKAAEEQTKVCLWV